MQTGVVSLKKACESRAGTVSDEIGGARLEAPNIDFLAGEINASFYATDSSLQDDCTFSKMSEVLGWIRRPKRRNIRPQCTTRYFYHPCSRRIK